MSHRFYEFHKLSCLMEGIIPVCMKGALCKEDVFSIGCMRGGLEGFLIQDNVIKN
jgi:hypothetical protein